MEELTDVLGRKIAALCEHIKQLKADNAKLAEDNAQLLVRVKDLEKSINSGQERAEKEKAFAKMAIDDLVETIDSLIGKEYQ